ncbi:MAG: (Fe-S)-binding protein [Fibrobacteria bacterium]
MKIQLFHTCIINEVYPEVGMSVVNILERLGVAVEVPASQTCCGQPAFNAGFHADARKVARHTLDLLSATEGPIVVPSGSCGDMITHQYHMLFQGDSVGEGGEPAYLAKAHAIAERCFEFSVFLVDVLGITNLAAHLKARAGAVAKTETVIPTPAKVAYHPSCHLLRGLGVKTQPRALLAGVDGLECSDVKDQEECCGFGGMFSVKNAAISSGMLENKLRNLEASGADTVVSCDMGCLMHLEGGLRRKGSKLQVKHISQVLEAGLK